MALNAIETVNFYKQADALRNAATARQLHQTNIFLAENGPVIEKATANVLSALDRFNISLEHRQKTATETVFLWTQAKLAQMGAALRGDNPISGFNVAAAIGIHLENPTTRQTEFFFSTGANREPDTFPLAIHAETSAIESARQQLFNVLEKDETPPGIDMIVLTGATPCGSCREEIYRHRTSDNTLVAVIDDKGNATINTIAELFPTKFQETDIKEIPEKLLTTARIAASQSIPSRYQQTNALPAWGVALGISSGQYQTGFAVGDDAFWSNTPTLDAIGKILRFDQMQISYQRGKSNVDYWNQIASETLPKVRQVVYYYSGPELEFYPSGKERQQLAVFKDDTEIFIVLGDQNKAFRTIRGELLPGAFVAPQS